MNNADIINFFDRFAPTWDESQVRNEVVIETILHNGGIRAGIDVLDVACGTGVLFPDYLKRGVASLTGIDISPAMAEIARRKFPEVEVICGDVTVTNIDRQFDVIMVYNAFPHFPDPAGVIEVLASLCKPGGRLSIAHGMSREALHAHHSQGASTVSLPLPEAEELAKLLAVHFDVDVVISNEEMYQVSGVKKQR